MNHKNVKSRVTYGKGSMLKFGSIQLKSLFKLRRRVGKNESGCSHKYARKRLYFYSRFILYLQNDSIHSTEMIRHPIK